MTEQSTVKRKRPDNGRMVIRLVGVVIAMFAFGYALVPLYDVFCEITGIGGKTGRTSEQAAAVSPVDTSRLITVQFTGTKTVGLPWEFGPVTRSVKVHPGAVGEATYYALNKSSRSVTGQAVPSVAPQRAARHFKKTECFCFTNQELAAGEHKEMPIRFVVDRDVPANVDTITLSYAFFNADKYADRPSERPSDSAGKSAPESASLAAASVVHKAENPGSRAIARAGSAANDG